jgi:hypothetical protein
VVSVPYQVPNGRVLQTQTFLSTDHTDLAAQINAVLADLADRQVPVFHVDLRETLLHDTVGYFGLIVFAPLRATRGMTAHDPAMLAAEDEPVGLGFDPETSEGGFP